jgi:hypothetical protein
MELDDRRLQEGQAEVELADQHDHDGVGQLDQHPDLALEDRGPADPDGRPEQELIEHRRERAAERGDERGRVADWIFRVED